MIDLSKSLWHKNIVPETSFISLLKRNTINAKLILGAAFMFVAIFNVKLSQVSLDFYTSTTYRSILVNVSTALADLTLCFALMKLKNKSCRPMSILIILLIISLLACKEMDFSEEAMKTITIVHSVLIRYLS
jgi:mannose/fructose/N-acetylgalactosamine-specific phosphotransferase system component IID